MPVRAIIKQGTTADCSQVMELIQGVPVKHLLADQAYDSNCILEQAEIQGMKVVIPPKKNRKQQREYDKYLYPSWQMRKYKSLRTCGIQKIMYPP